MTLRWSERRADDSRPTLTILSSPSWMTARAISGCRRRDRDFYPTLLGESSQDYPAVEPHIMLSKVWNVLAERAEPGAVPVSGG